MSVPKVAAVIGAGTMGPGMAAVLARAGSEVRLTALVTLSAAGAVAQARLVVGSIGGVPLAAEAAWMAGATPADFGSRAGTCAAQAAASCTPLPDGEASPGCLRHLVPVYACQALGEAFAAA
jgi:3-hydroxyacyl-CoA dehydrogenase, NAD binding domain